MEKGNRERLEDRREGKARFASTRAYRHLLSGKQVDVTVSSYSEGHVEPGVPPDLLAQGNAFFSFGEFCYQARDSD